MADEALKDVKAVKEKRFIILKARYRIANSQHFDDAVTAVAKGGVSGTVCRVGLFCINSI